MKKIYRGSCKEEKETVIDEIMTKHYKRTETVTTFPI